MEESSAVFLCWLFSTVQSLSWHTCSPVLSHNSGLGDFEDDYIRFLQFSARKQDLINPRKGCEGSKSDTATLPLLVYCLTSPWICVFNCLRNNDLLNYNESRAFLQSASTSLPLLDSSIRSHLCSKGMKGFLLGSRTSDIWFIYLVIR